MIDQSKPASSSDVPEWRRRLKQEIGEDPGRFLDAELVERGPNHTDQTNQRLVRARIRGIDRAEVARAWIAVERRLASEHDREPRQRVLELLEDRLKYLEDHGDREERVDLDAVPPVEERVDRRTAEEYEAMPTATPRPESYLLWGSPTERLAEKARAEGRTEDAQKDDDLEDDLEDVFAGLDDQLAGAVEEPIATDGGESLEDQEGDS